MADLYANALEQDASVLTREEKNPNSERKNTKVFPLKWLTLPKISEVPNKTLLSSLVFFYGVICRAVVCRALFGIADLTRLQLRKCNNHLVSFIKVDALLSSHTLSTFLPPLNQKRWSIVLWSVDIFDIIKSRTLV